ncbi:MAG TPA: YceH family protein [Pyrinomonadaceae bacterium]|jgi:hypothetical protein
MALILNETEVRVLGSLVEKQLTTPESYPMTLNALVAACNQKSNRDPVVSYDESTVTEALDSLRDKNLVYTFHGSTSRVVKYKHMLPNVYELDPAETAAMDVLMLRGPQTVGEIRGRTDRLFDFSGLPEVQETLDKLARRDEPLVVRLERQVGQKDARYAHLLSGAIDIANLPVERERPAAAGSHDQIALLRSEIETMKSEIAELKEEFAKFRQQFE